MYGRDVQYEGNVREILETVVYGYEAMKGVF